MTDTIRPPLSAGWPLAMEDRIDALADPAPLTCS